MDLWKVVSQRSPLDSHWASVIEGGDSRSAEWSDRTRTRASFSETRVSSAENSPPFPLNRVIGSPRRRRRTERWWAARSDKRISVPRVRSRGAKSRGAARDAEVFMLRFQAYLTRSRSPTAPQAQRELFDAMVRIAPGGL